VAIWFGTKNGKYAFKNAEHKNIKIRREKVKARGLECVTSHCNIGHLRNRARTARNSEDSTEITTTPATPYF
jgi:hypothetical protein